MDRPRELEMREVFNAVQFILGTGCQWRAIPKRFPPSASIQNHSYAWRNKGALERMLDVLRTLARELEGRAAEPTAAAIDSQSVKHFASNNMLSEVAQTPAALAARASKLNILTS